ncbi:MAG: hypothetical protein R3C18_17670 [Planctomycetaceae bacterium]
MKYFLHKILIVTFVAAFAGTAMALPPMSSIAVRANASIDLRNAYLLEVDHCTSVNITFEIDSHPMTEIRIYDTGGHLLATSGNQKPSQDTWYWRNNTGTSKTILITGWHKPPTGTLSAPYEQSVMTAKHNGDQGAVGFRDTEKNKTNNLVARYRIIR